MWLQKHSTEISSLSRRLCSGESQAGSDDLNKGANNGVEISQKIVVEEVSFRKESARLAPFIHLLLSDYGADFASL
jgi:hypothetical protein